MDILCLSSSIKLSGDKLPMISRDAMFCQVYHLTVLDFCLLYSVHQNKIEIVFIVYAKVQDSLLIYKQIVPARGLGLP